MPRHTRTHQQRRLTAYAQRRSERDLIQLARELRLLWRHYEAVNDTAGQDAGDVGDVDPNLALWSRMQRDESCSPGPFLELFALVQASGMGCYGQ